MDNEEGIEKEYHEDKHHDGGEYGEGEYEDEYEGEYDDEEFDEKEDGSDRHWSNDYQRILNIDDFTYENLKQMARWSRYLSNAVSSLLFLALISGLMILLFVPHFILLRHLGRIGFIVFFVLLVGFLIYPVYELYLFSTLMHGVLKRPHQGRFNTSIEHLKNAIRYTGILFIVFLSFCVLVFTGWLLL